MPNTIRVSLGLVSHFADVHRFMSFARESYRDRPSGGCLGKQADGHAHPEGGAVGAAVATASSP